MDYLNFGQFNDTFEANPIRNEIPNLPPGCYNLVWDGHRGVLLFKRMEIKHDKLIDLPSSEYDTVMRRITTFLHPETPKLFEKYGYLYKWSALLHGVPGTGKTCIVGRVAQKIIEKNGVVLFDPDPVLVPHAFKILDEIQPNRTTMVIFEEFDKTLIREESRLLSILDGEIQKNNVVYLATTNHYDQIPARLKRPGRFSTILEIPFPNSAAREVYLEVKFGKQNFEEIQNWVDATEGLSIDELSEVVRGVKCYGDNLEEVIARVGSVREGGGKTEPQDEDLETNPSVAVSLLQYALTPGDNQ